MGRWWQYRCSQSEVIWRTSGIESKTQQSNNPVQLVLLSHSTNSFQARITCAVGELLSTLMRAGKRFVPRRGGSGRRSHAMRHSIVLLQGAVHQGQVDTHPLEPDVPVLQFPQRRQVRDRHARALTLSLVVGRFAHAALAARLADLGANLDLLEDRDDLASKGKKRTERLTLKVEPEMLNRWMDSRSCSGDVLSKERQWCD